MERKPAKQCAIEAVLYRLANIEIQRVPLALYPTSSAGLKASDYILFTSYRTYIPCSKCFFYWTCSNVKFVQLLNFCRRTTANHLTAKTYTRRSRCKRSLKDVTAKCRGDERSGAVALLRGRRATYKPRYTSSDGVLYRPYWELRRAERITVRRLILIKQRSVV